MTPDLDVGALLEREAVETHFQPIFSVRGVEAKGVEALSRGRDQSGRLVPPAAMFRAAQAQGLAADLERLCWREALAAFGPLHGRDRTLVLFINLHAAGADDLLGPGGLTEGVWALGLDPRAVAVEFLESQFDAARLRELSRELRRRGFLVALDDLGTSHSNFERVLQVRPDVLKVDRSLVRGIDRDYYQREVVRSLVGLSEKVGGWVVAEGVERPEEALALLELQADLMQGFLFARPQLAEGLQGGVAVPEAVRGAATGFRQRALDDVRKGRDRRERRAGVARGFVERLAGGPPEAFERILAEVAARHPEVESVSVLDAAGTQVTETVWSPGEVEAPKSLIFRPPGRGRSHALKEYYYLLTEAGVDPFETRPYVPLPTGSLCVTLSTRFEGGAGDPYILCLHLNVDELQEGNAFVPGL